MAPAIHPACTPQASCAPIRCHPTGPPCHRPEKCINQTRKKNLRACESAVSVLRTKSLASCGSKCGKFSNQGSNPRSVNNVRRYLKKKSKETRMRKWDRLRGKHQFVKYQRKKGRKRSTQECCAGKGHRGRVKRSPNCTIL